MGVLDQVVDREVMGCWSVGSDRQLPDDVAKFLWEIREFSHFL